MQTQPICQQAHQGLSHDMICSPTVMVFVSRSLLLRIRWSSMHTPAGRRPPKRLLFDRRYGWVVDEWRDPSEEALAGGRGMFCILPIVKSLVNFASKTIDSIANTAVEALEKRGQNFSPKSLLGSIHEARESDHMDEHIAKNSHDGSKVDYMNKHLQKEALFDLTTKQI